MEYHILIIDLQIIPKIFCVEPLTGSLAIAIGLCPIQVKKIDGSSKFLDLRPLGLHVFDKTQFNQFLMDWDNSAALFVLDRFSIILGRGDI